jgi:magnesium and cobalt transporter
MINMTRESNTTDDPSSPQSSRPQLHVVTEDETQTQQTEKTPFGFIRTFLKGKSEEGIQDALKTLVADLENATPEDMGNERTLIENIISLRDMRAADVMIPRADIIAIDSSISNQEIFSLLAEKQFSRFPVYKESLDDVIGTIHIKDILACLARREEIQIENLVRDVPIVSPSMYVLDLLLEMKQTRRHMALVVDEFGGIDGLVTVGDIIQAIVGEIEDEHEHSEQPQMIVTTDASIVADGRVDVEEFESRFGKFLSDTERQDIDTLGGLVFAIAGRVPTRGEVLSHETSGIVFEVLDADPRRVSRLRIKIPPKETSNE